MSKRNELLVQAYKDSISERISREFHRYLLSKGFTAYFEQYKRKTFRANNREELEKFVSNYTNLKVEMCKYTFDSRRRIDLSTNLVCVSFDSYETDRLDYKDIPSSIGFLDNNVRLKNRFESYQLLVHEKNTVDIEGIVAKIDNMHQAIKDFKESIKGLESRYWIQSELLDNREFNSIFDRHDSNNTYDKIKDNLKLEDKFNKYYPDTIKVVASNKTLTKFLTSYYPDLKSSKFTEYVDIDGVEVEFRPKGYLIIGEKYYELIEFNDQLAIKQVL